jgi:hypothetical protein
MTPENAAGHPAQPAALTPENKELLAKYAGHLATVHTRAVQETGRCSGADGSVVTGTPGRSSGQVSPSLARRPAG